MPACSPAPFGSWASPLPAAAVAAAAVRLGQIQVDGEDVYWDEMRPAEGGRSTILRHSGGETGEILPQGYNARSLVHEYGGGSFCVRGGTVFFSNASDQRLYRLAPGAEPHPITPDPSFAGSVRYADGVVSADGRSIYCVRESHPEEGDPVNELVAVDATGATEPEVVASGYDFYSFPRLCPRDRFLAWTCWNHPNMPWDGTELWVAELAEGRPHDPRKVAGGPAESIFQPRWSPEGTLHFVSDRTGWWNLYRHDGERVEPVLLVEAELGAPQWVFGLSTYAFLPDGDVALVSNAGGVQRLGILRRGMDGFEEPEAPYTAVSAVACTPDKVFFVGAGPAEPPALVAFHPGNLRSEVILRPAPAPLPPDHVSVPESIECPGELGAAQALYYPPRNPAFEGLPGEKPPLIVMSHGGPTSQALSGFEAQIQFWTTRGFAVVDVNYGGSTGYGRAYRERLKGRWGIVDVADCVAVARFLAGRGDVDPGRLLIRGRSAGGYTTLCALTFSDVFSAGANYYGVADLEALAAETHKFEARYLDSLVGPYPESGDLYRERSPVHHADRITCPLITFQGMEDTVVPPEQSEAIVAALRRRGLPHAYVTYEGEQHGFRRAETISHALGAELSFYAQVLGFTPADDIEPVRIENLAG